MNLECAMNLSCPHEPQCLMAVDQTSNHSNIHYSLKKAGRHE